MNFTGTIRAVECRDEESWWFDNVCAKVDGDKDFAGYEIIPAEQ